MNSLHSKMYHTLIGLGISSLLSDFTFTSVSTSYTEFIFLYYSRDLKNEESLQWSFHYVGTVFISRLFYDEMGPVSQYCAVINIIIFWFQITPVSNILHLRGLGRIFFKTWQQQPDVYWLFYIWCWRLMPPSLTDGDFVWNMFFQIISLRMTQTHRWLHRHSMNASCIVFAVETVRPFSIKMGRVNCSQLLQIAWSSRQMEIRGWCMWA